MNKEAIIGCIYQGFISGKCQVYNEGIDNPGWDKNGVCICSDDPDPSMTCEDYQSDESTIDESDEDEDIDEEESD